MGLCFNVVDLCGFRSNIEVLLLTDDFECFQIQVFAVAHLIKCGFDDWVIKVISGSDDEND